MLFAPKDLFLLLYTEVSRKDVVQKRKTIRDKTDRCYGLPVQSKLTVFQRDERIEKTLIEMS